MLDTNWHQRENDVLQNMTVYVINKGMAFNRLTREGLNISTVDIEQPEYNLHKNCTAAFGHHLNTRYTWIVIPCFKKFTVSFFCQTKLLFPDLNFRSELNPINASCEDGWLMLVNRPVCYLLLTPSKHISFYEAEKECLLRNASMYKVTISPVPKIDDTWLKTWFEMLYPKVFKKRTPKKYTKKDLLRKIIFGTLLDDSNVENSLGQSAGMQRMFADVNSRCGIIESLPQQATMKIARRTQYSTTAWFHKYRPCSEMLSINVLVCEKQSEIYSQPCSSYHFKCSDDTCVLMIYRCDGLDDCFDASDEHACSYNKTVIRMGLKSPLNRLSHNLDCLLYNDCDETQYIRLPLHAMCDGIYTRHLSTEKEICRKNILNHISFSVGDKEKATKMTSFGSLIDIFIDEMKYLQKESKSYKTPTHNDTNTTANVTNYLAECKLNGEKRSVDNMCKVSVHIPACQYDILSKICLIIWCPGMFKCLESYCLPMSLVCDGYADCPDGEDELFCSSLICPGLLKCRGENKCVSVDELCDGQVNCGFSFDDEITCMKCPRGCICFYYIMSCEIINNLNEIAMFSPSYIKSLTIKGILSTITIKQLSFFPALIYIDLSFCGLQNILILGKFEMIPLNILFADLKHNNLSQINFLLADPFSHIVYVDLSSNRISYISSRLIQMQYMKILKIGNNPLNEIAFILRNNIHLRKIDLSHVKYSYKINVYIDTSNSKLIEVIVTDPTLCCMFKSRCKIQSGVKVYMCYQLIETQPAKWSFYILATIPFIMCNTQLFMIFLRYASQNKHVKYYNFTKINQSLTDLFLSLYFISLIFGDTLNINVVFWRNSVLCHTINVLFYVTILNSLVFKAFSAIMPALKIKFPFSHQCRWFRFTLLATFLVWVFSASIYSTTIGLSFIFLDNDVFVDKFCRFGECSKDVSVIPLIYVSILSIDVVFMILVFFFSIQASIVLRSNNISKTTVNPRGRFYFALVIFKVTRIFLIEMVFRFLLYILIFSKITKTPCHEKYCFLVFSVVFPIEVISCNIMEMLSFKRN